MQIPYRNLSLFFSLVRIVYIMREQKNSNLVFAIKRTHNALSKVVFMRSWRVKFCFSAPWQHFARRTQLGYNKPFNAVSWILIILAIICVIPMILYWTRFKINYLFTSSDRGRGIIASLQPKRHQYTLI